MHKENSMEKLVTSETSLCNSGLLWVLEDDPTKPTRADERLTANEETSADLNSIERYESKIHLNLL
jgi:hypothetical protein